ncbi:MAG TPA: hypothetical protein VI029_13135 [Mycobacterium sp.]
MHRFALPARFRSTPTPSTSTTSAGWTVRENPDVPASMTPPGSNVMVLALITL